VDGGQPCAFAYGEWSGRVYLYQIPGYDPKYAKKSPGTALMLGIIRDLIENTDARFSILESGGILNTKQDLATLHSIAFTYRQVVGTDHIRFF